MPDAPGVRELHEAATSASIAADYLALADLARRMIELSEGTDDARGAAWGRYFAGVSLYQRGDGMAARREFKASSDAFEKIGDREGVARGMLGLAVVALDVDADASEARHLYDLAAPILRSAGDQRGLGNVLGNLAEIYRLEGSPRRAEEHAEEALELFLESGMHALAGWQLTNIAHFRLLQRDEVGAIDSMHDAYDELMQIRFRAGSRGISTSGSLLQRRWGTGRRRRRSTRSSTVIATKTARRGIKEFCLGFRDRSNTYHRTSRAIVYTSFSTRAKRLQSNPPTNSSSKSFD